MVTHHVEEIPVGFDQALVLRGGRAEARGPVPETLTAPVLSRAFGLPLRVAHGDDGRLHARRAAPEGRPDSGPGGPA
jgi:iron complex transport system ATP-binding protein